MNQTITSRQNPLIVAAAALSDRKYREKEAAFLIEGKKLFEEAAAIAALVEAEGLTQEACAARLSVSQSYVANKMRLLRLTEAEQAKIVQSHLSERHCRALLRFPDPADREPVLDAMIRGRMNVAEAEAYVEELLCATARAAVRQSKPNPPRPRSISEITAPIDRALDIVRRSGISVESTRRETDGATVISITLKENAAS